MRRYATQMEAARQGIVTPERKAVAAGWIGRPNGNVHWIRKPPRASVTGASPRMRIATLCAANFARCEA